MAFALGADLVNVAREAMLSIGCIQAQKCHTDHCPTGVATQNPWLVRGLDPVSKAERCAVYLRTLRKEPDPGVGGRRRGAPRPHHHDRRRHLQRRLRRPLARRGLRLQGGLGRDSARGCARRSCR
ncbi:glutamate synthase-related protein [Nocardioides convexus]|uniref:glutamate synthase-related protein n=1 Tax=Nocardioides convexus TaxID=2712224 RepID=UPI002418195D|nr:glutamate synthase-related protein [Nocardioides convexus]